MTGDWRDDWRLGRLIFREAFRSIVANAFFIPFDQLLMAGKFELKCGLDQLPQAKCFEVASRCINN